MVQFDLRFLLGCLHGTSQKIALNMNIRTINQSLNRRLGLKNTTPSIKVRRGHFLPKTKSKKRLLRYGILALNVIVLTIATILVINNPNTSSGAKQSSLNGVSSNNVSTSPLDELSSADIAAQVAQLTKLPEATAVSNQADSANALLSISPTDDKVIAKPQVVNTTAKTRKDILRYVTVAGDSVGSLATKFGVTSDSIRWSNGLTSDTLGTGKELWLSPTSDGIVYIVKSGDTAQSLADRYRSSKDAITSFNDGEVSGLPVGERIVIPSGTQPSSRAGTTSFNFSWFGSAPIYSANGYDYGWCTWHVANRRREVGNPIPSNLGNANTWYYRSISLGIPTGAIPKVGAVVWHNPPQYLGHVAFVEKINDDGSILVSDMNFPYWGRVTSRTIPASEYGKYKFIY